MIQFPLILMGYALVPLIAVLAMVMSDRPQEKSGQSTFPQVEIL